MTGQMNPGDPSGQRPAPPPGPPMGAPFAPPPGPGQGAVPGAEVPVGPPPARRSRGKLIFGLVAVVALAGAGVFAVTTIAGGGDSEPAGQASPEELGDKLLVAFDDSDALAAAELLLPSERRVISDPAFDLIDELERLEVLSDVDVEQVNGIDVELDNTDVLVEETSVDDIAQVTITGQASVTVDGGELPTGPIIEEEMDEADSSIEEESDTQTEEFNLPLTAVEQDGEWYLSIGYTVAESARQTMYDSETGEIPEIPSAEDAITAVGGDSPEDAVEVMLDAAADKDVEAMVAALDPGEFGALQRYAPLFLGDAQESLDEEDVSFEVTESDLRVEGDGDTREVFVENFAVEVTGDGETAYIQYSEGCVSVETEASKDEVCFSGDQVEAELDDALDQLENPEPVEDFITAVKDSFADFEIPGVVVTEVDGQWFISPVGTFDGAMLNVAESLDADELRNLIDTGKEALDSAFDETTFED